MRAFASVSAANPPGPLLAVSSNGRYLIDTAHGDVPFFVHGEACWSAIVNLTDAEQDDYLENLAARGFNAVMVNLIEHEFGASAPNDTSGNAPFTGTAFQSSLGSAYRTRAKRFISKAASLGIVVFLNPNYAGWGGGSEGWHAEITAGTTSTAERQAYGSAVGSDYAEHVNIVWMNFGDYDPPSHTPYTEIRDAIAAADGRTLVGNHYGTDVSSHDKATAYTWDYIYKWGTPGSCYVHDFVDDGWVADSGPVIGAEFRYESENSTTALDCRRQAWGTLCAGGKGHFYSHRDIWGAGNGANQVGTFDDAINNVGSVAPAREQMAHLKAFADAHPGWELTQPDRTSTFITAGRGTLASASYVTACFSSTLGFAYLPLGTSGPSSGQITVDLSEYSGPITWHWYNPRTGGTSGGASGVSNSGTQNFTAPDGSDWVWVGWVP